LRFETGESGCGGGGDVNSGIFGLERPESGATETTLRGEAVW